MFLLYSTSLSWMPFYSIQKKTSFINPSKGKSAFHNETFIPLNIYFFPRKVVFSSVFRLRSVIIPATFDTVWLHITFGCFNTFSISLAAFTFSLHHSTLLQTNWIVQKTGEWLFSLAKRFGFSDFIIIQTSLLNISHLEQRLFVFLNRSFPLHLLSWCHILARN